jgi:hypothetical protein
LAIGLNFCTAVVPSSPASLRRLRVRPVRLRSEAAEKLYDGNSYLRRHVGQPPTRTSSTSPRTPSGPHHLSPPTLPRTWPPRRGTTWPQCRPPPLLPVSPGHRRCASAQAASGRRRLPRPRPRPRLRRRLAAACPSLSPDAIRGRRPVAACPGLGPSPICVGVRPPLSRPYPGGSQGGRSSSSRSWNLANLLGASTHTLAVEPAASHTGSQPRPSRGASARGQLAATSVAEGASP